MSVRTKTNIKKRRALAELYVRGVEVRFNKDGVNTGDPAEDDIVIFVTPPSPLQRDMAIREAQASRARAVLRARKDDQSEEFLRAQSYLADLTAEGICDYLIEQGEDERRVEAQRRVLAMAEWDDFDSLRDAMRQWEEAGFPDDEEWRPLIEKDMKFGEQVAAEMAELRDTDREALKMLPRGELDRRALDKRVQVVGTAEFMQTYERFMLWYACRDDEDHSDLFFESADEVREHPDFVAETLLETLNNFIDETADAKN